MLKRTLFYASLCLVASKESAALMMADDALHVAGVYRCHGYDSHDGGYDKAIATLAVDSQHSDFAHNYGAYHFTLVESDGVQYAGEAAANGNHLAIYFKNTSAAKADDQGVGIAVVSHDKNAKGDVVTAFHKFYYEPHYQGGGNGFETCIKQA